MLWGFSAFEVMMRKEINTYCVSSEIRQLRPRILVRLLEVRPWLQSHTLLHKCLVSIISPHAEAGAVHADGMLVVESWGTDTPFPSSLWTLKCSRQRGRKYRRASLFQPTDLSMDLEVSLSSLAGSMFPWLHQVIEERQRGSCTFKIKTYPHCLTKNRTSAMSGVNLTYNRVCVQRKCGRPPPVGAVGCKGSTCPPLVSGCSAVIFSY